MINVRNYLLKNSKLHVGDLLFSKIKDLDRSTSPVLFLITMRGNWINICSRSCERCVQSAVNGAPAETLHRNDMFRHVTTIHQSKCKRMRYW